MTTENEADNPAPKAAAKKAQATVDTPRDDRSYLKPGEEHLPEATQAEIIMGRKTLEMNNPKMVEIERREAEAKAAEPKNQLVGRSDPRFQQPQQSTLRAPRTSVQ